MKKRVLGGLLAALVALLAFAATASASGGGFNLTLQISPASVSGNSNVTFTGVFTFNGVGLFDDYVEVDQYTDPGCNNSPDNWADWNYTASNGSYSIGPDLGSDVLSAGSRYVRAWGWDFESETWTPSACVSLTGPTDVQHEFLCYSKWQTQPGVWAVQDATALLAEGYWLPTAVDGNVTGGTNVGKYNLQCNVTPKGDGWVGSTGQWYSGDWSKYAATEGGLYPH